METNEIIVTLESLGMGHEEAAAYVQLRSMGSSRASKVAGSLRITRPRAYRVLENLSKRGYVTVSLQRPFLFTAVEPDRVFDDLRLTVEERLREIQSARTRLEPALREVRPAAEHEAPPNAFRILQGRSESTRLAARMISSARRHVRSIGIVGSHGHRTNANGLEELMVRRADEGLEAYALKMSNGTTREPPMGRVPSQNVRTRLVEDLPPMRFLLKDDEELLVTASVDSAQHGEGLEEFGMWSDAPGFVRMHRAFFDQLWRNAKESVTEPGDEASARALNRRA